MIIYEHHSAMQDTARSQHISRAVQGQAAGRSNLPAPRAASQVRWFRASWLGHGWLPVALLSFLLGACDRSGLSSPAATPPGPGATAAAPNLQSVTAGNSSSAGAPASTRLPGSFAEGSHGAVSSAEANASDVGLEVLRRGGNAVDAAVAVGFALGVTHPSAGNIGGGGFMLVRTANGESTAIDYREVAPSGATPDMYLDRAGHVTPDSELGPRAAGIPGVVRGLAFAHRKFGKLPWAELIAPALKLAREGWRLDALHAEELREVSASIQGYAAAVPSSNPALRKAFLATLRTFRRTEADSYATGDLWRQPELAATLQTIMTDGPDAFYTGPLGREMASKVAGMGGLWTAADLEGYRVIERKPISFSYRDHEIISMPPPSAGGIVLRQILAASEQLKLYDLDWDSVPRMHLFVEVLRRSFADRNRLIGDPDFVKVPLEELLNVDYVAQRMANIDPARATPSSEIAAGVPLQEHKHTTHFSVVDASGMAVSNTYTLNGDFGAKVQITGTGVTLNNEMDDFTAAVGAPNQFGLIQGPQNSIQPGKRMLSSMSPTIIVKAGKLRAVIGSPGGPTIITTVAQIALQLIDTGRSLEQAVNAVRIHHQWLPDQIWYEPELPAASVQGLAALGHHLINEGSIGHANCIEVDPATGVRRAVADVARDGGKAVAY
jgi:gamma-glutamyltranspeptidase / glutathione hydrolase